MRTLRRPSRLPALALFSRPFDRTVAFQWFLMDISVRPGSSSTSDDHLFPSLEWPSASVSSSSEVHASRRMSGRRWFSHLHPARRPGQSTEPNRY